MRQKNYKKTDKDKQFENGNLFKYQSKFWGPETCYKAGCHTYDIYFSTSLSLTTNDKE